MQYSTYLIEDYSESLDDRGMEYLGSLQRIKKKMEELIESLLYYSRVGRSNLAISNQSLNLIISEVVDSFEIILKEEKISLKVDSDFPEVKCDQVRVREIFRNLVENACKYNLSDLKEIEVGFDPHKEGQYKFFVKDNGIGIPEEHFKSIFQMFKRLHAGSRFGGGTGAGLSLVKKIVDKHHGEIWVESEQDKGTKITFTLAA